MFRVVVLIAPPGGGKGTHARLLKEREGFHHLESSALIDKHKAWQGRQGTSLFVDDHVVIGLVSAELQKIPEGEDLVLDGFPRTGEQTNFLVGVAIAHGYDLTFVQMVVSDAECKRRAAMRFKLADVPRPEDSSEKHEERLEIYKQKLGKIISSVQGAPYSFHVVNGDGSIEEVWKQITEHLGLGLEEMVKS